MGIIYLCKKLFGGKKNLILPIIKYHTIVKVTHLLDK